MSAYYVWEITCLAITMCLLPPYTIGTCKERAERVSDGYYGPQV